MRAITLDMSATCTNCNRPVPLSRDEVALLVRASAAGIRLAELSPAAADCVKPLVRMGYLVKAANDDGPRGRSVLITEHGRNWLKANR